MREFQDISVVMDNKALNNICKKSLAIEGPRYSDLNHIIAQCTSSLTAGMRFGGALNADLKEFESNLLPYPDVQFLLSSLAPIRSVENINGEEELSEIAKSCFKPGTLMAECDPRNGKYMACCLNFRGSDITPRDANRAFVAVRY